MTWFSITGQRLSPHTLPFGLLFESMSAPIDAITSKCHVAVTFSNLLLKTSYPYETQCG
jgi:hypothetical protein